MKIYIIGVWLMVMGVSTLAQNTLSGTITDSDNNPLPASVYIPQLEIGTVAEMDGSYTLAAIPNGSYAVVYSFLGFASFSETISFSSTGVTRNVTLEESAVEMEEVIISTPFHKLQSENVMRVERISIEELQQSGAPTLSENLTKIPGVESVSTGAGIGKPVIRGLSSNRVLTYTQGVRLENQQFGDEHGLGINQAGVSSVEIIKGPASLLYGSDALGGVLYIAPERFADEGIVDGDISSQYFTNTEGYGINGGVKGSGKRWKYLTRASYAEHSDYAIGDEATQVTNTRFNETDFKTGIRYQNGMLKSTLRYNFNQSNIGLPEEIGIQTDETKPMLPYQQIDNHILSLENTLFFENSSLDITVGYLFNDRREFEDHHHHEEEHGDESHEGEEDEHDEHEEEEEIVDPALQLHLNTLNYTVKYNFPNWGKFETIVGVQGMFQQNDNLGEEILIPDARTTDVGIMGTTHFHEDWIDLQAGLRYDVRSIESEMMGNPADFGFIAPLDRDFNSFNAALGAKFNFTETLLVRVNIASGFRAPNLAELTSNGTHEGTNRYEIGNPNLSNEQNIQTDLSLEFGNEHLELYANGFYNYVSDFIFLFPTGEAIDEDPVFVYRQQDSKLYGGEVGLHLHPHPLDWLHVESSFETVTGTLDNGDYLPLIPANTLRNTLRINFNDGKFLKSNQWFFTLQNVFDKENVSAFETRTGGYALVSTGANTTFSLNEIEMQLGVTATNLLDKRYIAHLSRLKPDGIPNMGRNILFRAKVQF
ncbi:TonB-dependent receptor [Luteirhabdus pelagi]|uniref:TonB-dependent receptor n=1 Tax=Luteirhabdus pelagi TaxID=2792783 RepID=UPI001939DE44|nr:TonB-dependent receptor [Luteirhabdus pelagi]